MAEFSTETIDVLHILINAVVETYAGIGKDVQQIHLFIRLNDYKNKSRLIEIIIEICNADGAYHQNEKVLVELVKAYWT